MYYEIYKNLLHIYKEPDFKAVYYTVDKICKILESPHNSDIELAIYWLEDQKNKKKNIFTDLKSLLRSITNKRHGQQGKLEAFIIKLIQRN